MLSCSQLQSARTKNTCNILFLTKKTGYCASKIVYTQIRGSTLWHPVWSLWQGEGGYIYTLMTSLSMQRSTFWSYWSRSSASSAIYRNEPWCHLQGRVNEELTFVTPICSFLNFSKGLMSRSDAFWTWTGKKQTVTDGS